MMISEYGKYCQYPVLPIPISNGEELVGVQSWSGRGFSSRLELEWEEGIVNFLS